MRRRRLLLGAGVLALVAVGGFVLFLWLATPEPGVTLENFRRVRRGMGEKQVVALLGPAAKAYAFENRGWRGKVWVGTGIRVDLLFGRPGVNLEEGDEAGVVVHGFLTNPDWKTLETIRGEKPEGPFLDRLRRLLGW